MAMMSHLPSSGLLVANKNYPDCVTAVCRHHQSLTTLESPTGVVHAALPYIASLCPPVSIVWQGYQGGPVSSLSITIPYPWAPLIRCWQDGPCVTGGSLKPLQKWNSCYQNVAISSGNLLHHFFCQFFAELWFWAIFTFFSVISSVFLSKLGEHVGKMEPFACEKYLILEFSRFWFLWNFQSWGSKIVARASLKLFNQCITDLSM